MNWLDYSKKSSSDGNEFGTPISSGADLDSYVSSFAATPLTGDSEGFDFGKLFGDKYMMGNITGLAGTLAQLASLPAMKKQAKLQNQTLQYNLDTAKEEKAKQNTRAANFASAGTRYT